MSAVPAEVHSSDATAEDLRHRLITMAAKYMPQPELVEFAALVGCLDAAAFVEGQHSRDVAWDTRVLGPLRCLVTKMERASVPKQVAL